MSRQAIGASLAEAIAALSAAGRLPAGLAIEARLERPREPGYGDYTTNVAFQLAKASGTRPLAMAEALAAALAPEAGFAVSVAPPGYLNLRLGPTMLAAALERMRTREVAGFAAPPLAGMELAAWRWGLHRAACDGLVRLAHSWGEGLKVAPRYVEIETQGGPRVGQIRLMRDGQPVRSTRPEREAALRAAGEEAAVLAMLAKPIDQPIELDLSALGRETADQPYFYLTHALARLTSVLRMANEAGVSGRISLEALASPEARALLIGVADAPGLVAEAARDAAPYRAVRFAEGLATDFHRFYATARVVGVPEETAAARVALLEGAQRALAGVLNGGLGLPAAWTAA